MKANHHIKSVGRTGLLFLGFAAILFIWNGSVLGQTYTTSGVSADWDGPPAWVITNPDNCPSPNTAETPPLGPVVSLFVLFGLLLTIPLSGQI